MFRASLLSTLALLGLFWVACSDKKPPLIAIVSPKHGARVGDTVNVIVEAYDNEELYYVEIYIDDSLVDRYYDEPYEYIWLTDTLDHLSNHSICAGAVDMALNIAESDAISVTVVHPGILRWQLQLGETICDCPAVGSDGTVYVTCNQPFPGHCYLHAINPNGTQKWQCQLGVIQASAPAIGPNGTIYVSAQVSSYPSTFNMAAIHPTGAPIWEVSIGAFGGPAVGADGAVYAGHWDGLYVYNPDGTLRWHYELAYSVYVPAIAADGTIYFWCGDGYLYALNSDTTLKWRYHVQLYSNIAIGADGAVYFGAADDYLYALNSDGTLRWRYYTTYEPITPIIGFGGLIYTRGLVNGELCYVALDQNGTLAWSGPPEMYPYPGDAVAVAADSTVYVISDALYALTLDHELKWRCDDVSTGQMPFTIGQDGTIFVASGGCLYAVNGLAPLASTPWPKVRHDAKNTSQAGY